MNFSQVEASRNRIVRIFEVPAVNFFDSGVESRVFRTIIGCKKDLFVSVPFGTPLNWGYAWQLKNMVATFTPVSKEFDILVAVFPKSRTIAPKSKKIDIQIATSNPKNGTARSLELTRLKNLACSQMVD